MEVRNGYKQTEVGVIPEDWVVKVIGNEIDLLTGFPFPSSGYKQSGIKLLRGSNIKRGVIDWSPEITQYWGDIKQDINKYRLLNGDIVIAMDGSLVGRSFARLTSADLPALLLQRVARIRSITIDMGYLKEFICSDYFTKHCDSVKTITAIPHISPNDIRTYKIPLPPTVAEQTAIATTLSNTDTLIQSLEKLIAKKRTIKQGTMQNLLTGRKRLPEFSKKKDKYKHTESGLIPEDWTTYTIGDLINFQGGSQPDKRTFVFSPKEGYTRLIQIRDYKTDKYKTYIPTLLARRFCNKDDIMIGRYGPPIFQILRGIDGAYNVALIKAIPNEKLDKLYAYYFLKQDKLFNFIEKLSQRSSGQTGVDIIELKSYPIPLPQTMDEQIAIATTLSDMDAEIAALESKLAKYKQIKQGMMQTLLTGRIRLV